MSEKLDQTDGEIVRLLQIDGRMSNKELAARVGLAPSSCMERVRWLRERKILKGIHAEVDPAALGIGLQALYLIEMAKHRSEFVGSFQEEVLAMPEVMAVYLVAGRYDFMVHVAVRDSHHLRDLTIDTFMRRAEVARIETVLIFDFAQRFELPNFRNG